MKKNLIFFLAFILFGMKMYAQPELRFVAGQQDTVRVARHFFRGMTVPNSQLTVNDVSFPVFSTGAFAAEVNLTEGSNKIRFVVRHSGQETVRDLDIYFEPRRPPQATARLEIEQAELIPNVSMVMPGDVLKVQVKTIPGAKVTWLDGNILRELPAEVAGVAGIFQGKYIVQKNDSLLASPITVTATYGKEVWTKEAGPFVSAWEIDTVKQSISKEITTITVLDPLNPLFVRSRGGADAQRNVITGDGGVLPFLNYGLGRDRLGGSRMGYISPGIDMQVLGKVGNLYQVRLSQRRTAWIPESQVHPPAPQGLFRPPALTSSWSVFGDDRFDYVRIAVSDRVPFRSFQEINPNRVVVDIFGVTTNTAWITQLFTTQTIANVSYEQIDDDVLRIFIDLNTTRHWGYSVFYEGNQLVIRLRHQPMLRPRLRGMRIALDAGHGGEHPGAVGTTGMTEKEVNLDMTFMLKKELERRGAQVILTRSDDTNPSMQQRMAFLREQMPDLLISIHNNAGGNPITTRGTSMYYRHMGSFHLSEAILKRLLELDGVENFGNVGAFNFALNSLTEFPTVLFEGLFMSTPSDEEKLACPRFRRQMVRQIVRGLEDFLRDAR